MTIPTRIIVTGGSGFVGRRLVKKLREDKNNDVWAPTHDDCDLLSAIAVRRLFEEVKPHLVYHLAARVGGIGANQLYPAAFFHDNMLMGMNVLEQGRYLVDKTVLVGTVCSYPKFTPTPFKEDNLWDGFPEETNAPYGIAKKALLVMAQAYRQQYGHQAIMVLPANMYGPGDSTDLATNHVIPAMIRKFVDAKDAPVTLWGDGSPTREFLYVDDCVEGLMLAAERYNDPEPVNLGTGCEISMFELAEMIKIHCGSKSEIIWDASRPNGQPRRVLDTSRAKAFGFTAKTSLSKGLDRTIAWYGARP